MTSHGTRVGYGHTRGTLDRKQRTRLRERSSARWFACVNVAGYEVKSMASFDES